MQAYKWFSFLNGCGRCSGRKKIFCITCRRQEKYSPANLRQFVTCTGCTRSYCLSCEKVCKTRSTEIHLKSNKKSFYCSKEKCVKKGTIAKAECCYCKRSTPCYNQECRCNSNCRADCKICEKFPRKKNPTEQCRPTLTTQVETPVLMQKLGELDTFAGNSSPRLSQAVVDKAKEYVEKTFYQTKSLNNMGSLD